MAPRRRFRVGGGLERFNGINVGARKRAGSWRRVPEFSLKGGENGKMPDVASFGKFFVRRNPVAVRAASNPTNKNR